MAITGEILKGISHSGAIEFGLHILMNVIVGCSLAVAARRQQSKSFDINDNEDDGPSLFNAYIFASIGGLLSCSLMNRRSLQVWIGYSVIVQLCFLLMFAFRSSDETIIRTTDDLLNLLLAHFVSSFEWCVDGFFLAVFHLNLVWLGGSNQSAPFVVMYLFGLSFGLCIWRKFGAFQNKFVLFCGVSSSLAISMSNIQSYSGDWTRFSCILAFSLFIRYCRIDLSPSEQLLLYKFTQIAIYTSCSGTIAHGSDTVVVVSIIGVMGVIFLGVVLSIVVQFAEWLRPEVFQKKSYAPSALLFAFTIFIVIVAFIIPEMEKAISLYSGLSGFRSHPISWIWEFLATSQSVRVGILSHRMCICTFWVVSLLVFLPSSQFIRQVCKDALPQISSRKLFHFLSVFMFAPVIVIDPEIMFLSFAVAVSGLLLFEYVRCFNICNVRSSFLNSFYIMFMDSRDISKNIATTHIQLLLGCAIPFFVHYALNILTTRQHFSFPPCSSLLPFIGLITVGIGDSFAAIVGSKFGKHRWLKNSNVNKRTMEGTAAGFISMCISSVLLVKVLLPSSDAGWAIDSQLVHIATFIIASCVETFCSDSDNVIMPLVATNAYLALSFLFDEVKI